MSDLIFYTTEDSRSQIKLHTKNKAAWLTQREMADLFDVSTDNVGLHLKNLSEDEELAASSVTEESSVTAADGKNHLTKLYNLNAILAVSCRVRYKRGVQFRRWAATILKAYGRRLLPQMGQALSAKFGQGFGDQPATHAGVLPSVSNSRRTASRIGLDTLQPAAGGHLAVWQQRPVGGALFGAQRQRAVVCQQVPPDFAQRGRVTPGAAARPRRH